MSKEHVYEIGGINFKGYFAQANSNEAPCVLIAVSYTHLTLPTTVAV